MNKYKLTIVMPSYNRAEYIRQAIDSVLMQRTKYAYHLVIADDCSTDDSQNIINEYVLKHPQLISAKFADKNRGIYENTLPIFVSMESEYFCVLDPDDYWLNDAFIENAIEYLDSHKEFVCYGANTIYVEDGIETDKKYYDLKAESYIINNIEEYFSKQSVIPHTTGGIYRNVVYKGSVPAFLQNIKDDASKQSFRADTGRYMMHLKYGKAYFTNEVVGAYRVHKNGVWTSTSVFHRYILNARAFSDFMYYYEGVAREQFMNEVKLLMDKATAYLMTCYIYEKYEDISSNDMHNYIYCNNELRNYYNNEMIVDTIIDVGLQIKKLVLAVMDKKIVVWGTGKATERLLEEYHIPIENILYFIDKNEEKCKALYKGKSVNQPAYLRDVRNYDYLLIGSSYHSEIIDEILEKKYCDDDKIINIYNLDRIICSLTKGDR